MTAYIDRKDDTGKLVVSSIKVATEYRHDNNLADRGGVVIVYEGKAQGWCNELRAPGHWVAGCVAVDEAGYCWETAAGDERHGALVWLPLSGQPASHPAPAREAEQDERLVILSASGRPMLVDRRICQVMGIAAGQRSPFASLDDLLLDYLSRNLPALEDITVTIRQVGTSGQAWLEATAPQGQSCRIEDPDLMGDTWEEQQAAMREWLIELIRHHRACMVIQHTAKGATL